METINYAKFNFRAEKVWDKLMHWNYMSITPRAVMDSFYMMGISYGDAQRLAKRFNVLKDALRVRASPLAPNRFVHTEGSCEEHGETLIMDTWLNDGIRFCPKD